MENGHVLADRQLPGGAGPPMDPSLLPHDSWKANIIAASVICYVIAVLFVAARVYTRKVLMRVYSWDDTCLIISVVRAELSWLTYCEADVVVRLFLACAPLGRYTVPRLAWVRTSGTSRPRTCPR